MSRPVFVAINWIKNIFAGKITLLLENSESADTMHPMYLPNEEYSEIKRRSV